MDWLGCESAGRHRFAAVKGFGIPGTTRLKLKEKTIAVSTNAPERKQQGSGKKGRHNLVSHKSEYERPYLGTRQPMQITCLSSKWKSGLRLALRFMFSRYTQ
ncbi:hypothetical protein A0H81_05947 [Grifola frondosa]|uniref:Uncharacterized protein n=1 Tax=Grifola frondosa TaxID=5627 RepID=A0A1C7M9H8_GRIFR|nr:hypothetical protein A0H81_05947 [Grifola frondosa]